MTASVIAVQETPMDLRVLDVAVRVGADGRSSFAGVTEKLC